jgi:hypothetical protein
MAKAASAAPSFWQGFQVFVRPPGWCPPWLLTTRLDKAPISPQTVVKHEVAPRQGLNAYVGVQFAIVAAATFTLLMFGDRLSLWTRGALAVWTIASLWAWGALLEAKSWGVALEATRLLFGCLAGAVWMRSAGLPAYDMVPAFGVAVSSMFWLFRLCAAWSRRDGCNVTGGLNFFGKLGAPDTHILESAEPLSQASTDALKSYDKMPAEPLQYRAH